MASVRLYFKLAKANIMSQMQYKTSFLMSVVGSFFASFVDVIALFIMFDRFKMIQGWLLSEICLMYGILHMSFSVVEAVARGFDTFGRLIRTGHLDRILVRPQSIILQVLGSQFKANNIGRFLQGVVAFLYGFSLLHISQVWQYGLILLAFVNSGIVFYSLLLIQATISFWAVESIEVMNAFTYGGLQMGQFPLTIYDKWFANFFTFVIPIALTVYFPVVLILNKSSEIYYSVAGYYVLMGPVISIFFYLISKSFFEFGVKQYKSTGS